MKHQQTILLLLARMLERAGFYGLRSILVLYMVYGALHFEEEHASNVYRYFLLGVFLSYVPGALLGDLLLGNKRAAMIGVGLMASGAFLLCVPMPAVLYGGLALIGMGVGLFDSNFLSLYARNFLDRKRQLDGGFALLYAFVNFGAFAGTFFVMNWVDDFDYWIGFAIGGLLFLSAAILSAFVKSQLTFEPPQDPKYKLAFPLVTGCILIAAIFWIIYDFTGGAMGALQQQIIGKNIEFSWIVQGSAGMFTLPICLIAAVVWSLFYYNSWVKLASGFLFGAAAFFILSTINVSSFSIPLYGFAMFLLALAEVHIQPIVYAFIAKHSNPKYLSVVFSLMMMPTKILGYLYPVYQLHRDGNETNEFLIGAVVLSIIGLGLGVFFMVKGKSPELA